MSLGLTKEQLLARRAGIGVDDTRPRVGKGAGKGRYPRLPAIDRFWANVMPEPNSGCWLWAGAVMLNGYGRIRGYDGKGIGAHRFSYLAFRGAVPEGMMVCHKCDVPSCVNPDHLWLGTPADNKADCVSKGRHVRGEKNHTTILSDADVKEILKKYRDGCSPADLVTLFNTTDRIVERIISRETWRHLNV